MKRFVRTKNDNQGDAESLPTPQTRNQARSSSTPPHMKMEFFRQKQSKKHKTTQNKAIQAQRIIGQEAREN